MKQRIETPERLRPLFAHHQALRAVVDAVLEGRMGAAWGWAQEGASSVKVARLDLGCYGIFGGDPDAPEAEDLLRDFAHQDFRGRLSHPAEILPGTSDTWWRKIETVLGPLKEDPMATFALAAPDRPGLEERTKHLPAAYSLAPIDRELALQLDAPLEPHALQAFDDLEDFLACGLGVAVVWGLPGQDRRVACVATPYALAKGKIELAIATHPEHRRRGLAEAAAARLILDCLEQELHPDWSAANPVSQHLALKLGYRRQGTCPSRSLPEPAVLPR